MTRNPAQIGSSTAPFHRDDPFKPYIAISPEASTCCSTIIRGAVEWNLDGHADGSFHAFKHGRYRRGYDGHRDLSNPFRVEVLNDLALEVQPPNLVAGWGQDFTSIWTIRNSGTNSAEDVRLADVLPASLTMISAIPSQGSCTIDNGILRCSFGSVPAGASASLSLVLNAAQPGYATNLANLVSVTPETWTTNNRASQICFVSPPTLYSTNIVVTEGNQGPLPPPSACD